MIVYTIGHSTRSAADFIALLEREGVRHVVDIRAFPGSRRYPQFNSEVLRTALREHGIGYEHRAELGGRRKPIPGAPPSAWRNASFAAYADYMRTDAFRSAVVRLIATANEQATAIMCSEAVPWRCHRSLVSDALTARGVEVRHILDAKTTVHIMTSFARLVDGEVAYGPVDSRQWPVVSKGVTRKSSA